MSGAYRVLANCIIRGKPCRRGDTVTLDDAEAAVLLSMGRIEGANDATASRIRRADVVRWSGGLPAALPPERDPWVRRHP